MAYDERLAERIRGYSKRRKGVEGKRMFGGLCFMLNGHMCCGIEKDRLMVRVAPDRYETLLKNHTLTRWILPASHSRDSCSSVKLAIARHRVWISG